MAPKFLPPLGTSALTEETPWWPEQVIEICGYSYDRRDFSWFVETCLIRHDGLPDMQYLRLSEITPIT